MPGTKIKLQHESDALFQAIEKLIRQETGREFWELACEEAVIPVEVDSLVGMVRDAVESLRRDGR